MLRNDPPSGTKVRFLRDLQKARANATAVLVRPLGEYTVDRPEDRFEVDFQGERVVVQRQDIE